MFTEIIWVIITVAEGGLLGLTQQMSTFNSLGSPAPNGFAVPQESNIQQRNPFGATAASSYVSADHQSPLLANCLTRDNQVCHDSSEMEEMRSDSCQISLNGSFDGSPLIIHNHNIDRLKSTPVDDNQENCFKICNNVLTRSPVTETRRSSIGRSFSLSHSPQQSVASQSQSSFDVASSLKNNTVLSSGSSAPLSNPDGDNAESSKGHFPPTPPAEDMML